MVLLPDGFNVNDFRNTPTSGGVAKDTQPKQRTRINPPPRRNPISHFNGGFLNLTADQKKFFAPLLAKPSGYNFSETFSDAYLSLAQRFVDLHPERYIYKAIKGYDRAVMLSFTTDAYMAP